MRVRRRQTLRRAYEVVLGRYGDFLPRLEMNLPIDLAEPDLGSLKVLQDRHRTLDLRFGLPNSSVRFAMVVVRTVAEVEPSDVEPRPQKLLQHFGRPGRGPDGANDFGAPMIFQRSLRSVMYRRSQQNAMRPARLSRVSIDPRRRRRCRRRRRNRHRRRHRNRRRRHRRRIQRRRLRDHPRRRRARCPLRRRRQTEAAALRC